MSVELRGLKYRGEDPTVSYANEGFTSDSRGELREGLPSYDAVADVREQVQHVRAITPHMLRFLWNIACVVLYTSHKL